MSENKNVRVEALQTFATGNRNIAKKAVVEISAEDFKALTTGIVFVKETKKALTNDDGTPITKVAAADEADEADPSPTPPISGTKPATNRNK